MTPPKTLVEMLLHQQVLVEHLLQHHRRWNYYSSDQRHHLIGGAASPPAPSLDWLLQRLSRRWISNSTNTVAGITTPATIRHIAAAPQFPVCRRKFRRPLISPISARLRQPCCGAATERAAVAPSARRRLREPAHDVQPECTTILTVPAPSSPGRIPHIPFCCQTTGDALCRRPRRHCRPSPTSRARNRRVQTNRRAHVPFRH